MFSFRTAPSKPKRRMVSAVRDFPLGCGCGPLAHRIQSSEVLETLVPAKVLEQKYVDEPVEICSLVSEALNKGVLSEPVKDLEDAAFDLSKIHVVGASASKEEIVSPSSLKSCSPSDVSTGSGLQKTMAKTFASRRTVSAIRDFPPLCGRNAPRLSKEESLEVRASMKNKSLCQDESDIANRPLEETRKANVKQMVEDVQDGDAQKSDLWGNVASLKNKSLCQDKSDVYDRPVEETRKADLRRMIEDVQDGDELWGNVASPKNKSLCQDKSNMYDRPVQETKKADLRRMVEDVQDGDEQNSELWGNVSMITGDKIRAKSDRHATKEIGKQDEFGMASKVKVEQDDTREMCTRPSSQTESNQHQSDHKSKTVVKIESRDIGGLEEKNGKEIVVYEKDSSLKRKLSDIYGYQIQLQEDFGCLEPAMESAMVQGLMAVPRHCWKQGKGVYKPYTAGVTSQSIETSIILCILENISQLSQQRIKLKVLE